MRRSLSISQTQTCFFNSQQEHFQTLTGVLLDPGEGLLEGVGGRGALGGVGRQAVGVHSLHSGVSVGLVRDAGESVDDGRDDAGHSRGGDVGRWGAEACWRDDDDP